MLYYNISNDCIKLGKNSEGYKYCLKGLVLLELYDKLNYSLFKSLYRNLRILTERMNHFQEALAFADSTNKYLELEFEKQNTVKMLEIQGQYEFERKQRQIIDLEQQEQNGILLLICSFLFLVLVLFFTIRLRSANRKLYALNKLKEHFIQIIAHDLRRPLHAFYGMSDLIAKLLKKGDHEAIVKISKSMDESSSKIRQMLDNLTYWALSQKEDNISQAVRIQLLPKLQEVTTLYQAVSISRAIKLEIKCTEDIFVYTDANALDLILRNLIDNASKAFAHKKEGYILIEAHKQEGEYGIVISLSDNGLGMNTEKLTLVRMALANKITESLQERLGLGIVIVGYFAQINNIKINVYKYPLSISLC